MPDAERPVDRLMVLIDGSTAFVRVVGRGTFKISTALKDFSASALDRGVSGLVLDLSECTGMDSTFMGVIAGLAIRFRKAGRGRVAAVNLSSKTRNLLGTLGLDHLIDTCMPGATPDEYRVALEAEDRHTRLEASPADEKRTAETILEAHEDLVEIHPANLQKFKDVLEFLREDMRKWERKEGGTA